MNFIKRFFSGMKQEEPVSESVEVVKPVVEQKIESTTSSTVTTEPDAVEERFSDEPPAPRVVLHAPVVSESIFPAD